MRIKPFYKNDRIQLFHVIKSLERGQVYPVFVPQLLKSESRIKRAVTRARDPGTRALNNPPNQHLKYSIFRCPAAIHNAGRRGLKGLYPLYFIQFDDFFAIFKNSSSPENDHSLGW